MPAATLDLLIEQGATWRKTLTLTDSDTGQPVDLTGYTFRSQLRSTFDDDTIAATVTCALYDASAGMASMSLSAADTAAIPAGVYRYDVEFVRPDTSVVRLLQGKVKVTPEVTR